MINGLSDACHADDCDGCTSPYCQCECHSYGVGDDWWESE